MISLLRRQRAAMRSLRLFVVNSILSCRLIPIVLRGPAYRLCGIRNHGRISFGVYFGSFDVRIGADTYVNANCFFDTYSTVTVGDDCLIGMDVLFCTSGHEILGPGRYGPPDGRPITVGDRCWIGARSSIMPGVSICDDVVIGAGAVVTQPIFEPGIYVGVPAQKLR